MIGDGGTGEYNISGGSASLEYGLSIGEDLGSSGTVTQTDSGSGSTVTIGSGYQVNFGSGTGTYNLNGGTLEVGGTDGIQAGSGTANFSMGGGTLQVVNSDLTVGSGIAPVLTTATSSTINTGGFNATFDGVFSGTGDLNKSGAGELILNGTSTGTGELTVADGEVFVEGTWGGDVVVNSGALLAGSGTVTGAATIEGTIAPGSSPGTLTFSDDVNLAAVDALIFELGTSSDQVVLTSGVLTIGAGTLGFSDFSFVAGAGFIQPVTTVYTLFDSTQVISGSLDGGDLTGTIGGRAATLSLGDSGNDINLTVVPEPATFGMIFGVLTLGLAVTRRRRR